ncbi:maltotransferase domain-containing protein, partial [Streptomyces cinereospinus]|uniref:maltotransferase domain-containing protein n=1 Tax=Streptomyces cinereospinus TaxID=285561 RepID=UPI00362084A4
MPSAPGPRPPPSGFGGPAQPGGALTSAGAGSRAGPRGPAPSTTEVRPMSTTEAIGRIPVRDVHPAVDRGRRPAKAVPGETFQVTATVFREGHDAVAANVVLR